MHFSVDAARRGVYVLCVQTNDTARPTVNADPVTIMAKHIKARPQMHCSMWHMSESGRGVENPGNAKNLAELGLVTLGSSRTVSGFMLVPRAEVDVYLTPLGRDAAAIAGPF